MPIVYDGDTRRLSSGHDRNASDSLYAARGAATRKPKGHPDFGNRRVDHTRRAGIVQAIATMISENTATVR